MTIPDYFKQLGLSTEKATLYLTLLNSGPQTAISLAKLSGIKRTYVYHLSQELAKENLIKLSQKGRTTFFMALSPDTLLARAEERQTQARLAMAGLEAALPELQSKYRLTDSKPAVTYYEGVAGLKRLYKDVIQTSDDVLLFRSIEDNTQSEALDILKEHVDERKKAGIYTRAVTPVAENAIRNYFHGDKDMLFERHFTKNKHFLLPSQIMVYGTKVAITSFDTHLTTIIDNEEINKTFRQLFQLHWDLTETEHQQIVSTLKDLS